jgi:hypothetical protein
MNSPSVRRIDKIAFDVHAIPLVAALLGGQLSLAPFRLPGADVWRLDVPGVTGSTAVTLTLWPSIARVDASSPALTVVITEIAGVELVEGVEVLFRRTKGEYLIIPIGGKVIVRA